MHFRGIKPQWAYYETRCFSGNKFPLYDQRRLIAECDPGQIYQRALLPTVNHRLATFLHGFAEVKYQRKPLLTFLVNITILMTYTQKALNFLIKILCYPSFLQNTLIFCNATTLCSYTLCCEKQIGQGCHNTFYLWFLDSFSSGSVIIWQTNMKLLRFIFQIRYLISDNVPTELVL